MLKSLIVSCCSKLHFLKNSVLELKNLCIRQLISRIDASQAFALITRISIALCALIIRYGKNI